MLLAAVLGRAPEAQTGGSNPWKGKPMSPEDTRPAEPSEVLCLYLTAGRTAGLWAAASVSNTWLLSPSSATEELDFTLQLLEVNLNLTHIYFITFNSNMASGRRLGSSSALPPTTPDLGVCWPQLPGALSPFLAHAL